MLFRSSVVATASYEARNFGCHSAQPMSQALRLCPQAVVVPPDFARYRAASTEFWSAPQTYLGERGSGLDMRAALWASVLERAGLDDAMIPTEAAERYAEARRLTYALFDDVRPFLEWAAPRFRLAVLTNGTADVQREKLAKFDLLPYFRAVVCLADIGAAKPAAKK